MKRFVSFLLIAIVGVPWTAVPAAKSAACAMPSETAAAPATCSYCAPVRGATTPSPTIPTLESGCCRYAPKAESVAAQAGSLGTSPKPSQSPDLAAAIPFHGGAATPAAPAARSNLARGVSPPHAPPTRTTHLLL